jgi:hypothetical protein
MQCSHNLILPIVVPIVSYLLLKSFTSGHLDQSPVSSDISQQSGGELSSKMKEDQEQVEMKRWSSRNLRINDPNYNQFIKHEGKSLLCNCSNCISAREQKAKPKPRIWTGPAAPMINLD